MTDPLHPWSWPLHPCPFERAWWQKLIWWSRAGQVVFNGEHIAARIDGQEGIARFELLAPIAAHLSVWPDDDELAWLGLTLGQGPWRIKLIVQLPWTAIPDDTPFLRMVAPELKPEGFAALWATVRHAESTRGVMLPTVAEGAHSGRLRESDQARAILPSFAPKEARSGASSPAEGVAAVEFSSREQLKTLVRGHHPESFLRCSRCGAAVKARNMLRHFDKEHSTLFSGLRARAPKPAPTPPPTPKARHPRPPPASPQTPPTQAETITWRSRGALKATLRERSPDAWVRCPRCAAVVKVRGMLRHVDQLHSGE